MECRQQSQELNPVDGNPKDLKKSLDESAGGRRPPADSHLKIIKL